MALYGIEQTFWYYAWDTNAQAGKTGDALNHTLRWVKDGASGAPTNSPAEVDATNASGLYKLVLTATECQALTGALHGVSSTSGIVILPTYVSFHKLPNVAAGANGGLPTVNASNYVAGVQGTVNNLNNLDAAVSSRSDFDEASDQVTVATNNDKTGYSISGTLNTLDDIPQPYIKGTVNDASPAAGDFDGDAGLSTTDDFYNNAFLVFTNGTLKGIARPVQDYTGTSRNLDFTSQEFPTPPANGDAFMIIGRNP